MRCGAKCFTVELEKDGEMHVISVTTRTPIEARKAIRIEYGKKVHIFSVREEKK